MVSQRGEGSGVAGNFSTHPEKSIESIRTEQESRYITNLHLQMQTAYVMCELLPCSSLWDSCVWLSFAFLPSCAFCLCASVCMCMRRCTDTRTGDPRAVSSMWALFIYASQMVPLTGFVLRIHMTPVTDHCTAWCSIACLHWWLLDTPPPPLSFPTPCRSPGGGGGGVTWSTQNFSLRLVVLLCG